MKKFFDKNARVESLKSQFPKRNFVKYHYTWQNRGYYVPPIMYLKVTLNALLYWPEAVEKVERIRRTGKSERYRMVSSLVESDDVFLPLNFSWTTYDSENAEMLQMVVVEPAFYAMFPRLNASLVHTTPSLWTNFVNLLCKFLEAILCGFPVTVSIL